MGHLQDWWEVVRARTLPWLHRWLALVGAYTEGRVARSSYALTADLEAEALERRLHAAGFVRNPLAALKRRPTNREVGSWAWRRTLLADRQLHLVLFPRPNADGTDVYAHEEPSWITHPIAHYRERGIDIEAGVDRTRARFEAAAIPFHYGPTADRTDPGPIAS